MSTYQANAKEIVGRSRSVVDMFLLSENRRIGGVFLPRGVSPSVMNSAGVMSTHVMTCHSCIWGYYGVEMYYVRLIITPGEVGENLDSKRGFFG